MAGQFGSARELDDIYELIAVVLTADHFDVGSALTISAWVNPAAVPKNQVVISKQLGAGGGGRRSRCDGSPAACFVPVSNKPARVLTRTGSATRCYRPMGGLMWVLAGR